MMSPLSSITVVLVHGAFAENASWDRVIGELAADGVRALAASNPLRGVASDAAAVARVVAGIDGRVVLVGHSYGGMVITQAASGLANVEALVFAGAFAPDTGESAAGLTELYPGSTLSECLERTPLRTGEVELTIRRDRFRAQFCADVDERTASLLAATQRPIAERALDEPLSTAPAWRDIPSWFVYGSADRSIPEAALAFFAQRARSQGTTRVDGASHAIGVAHPEAVARAVLAAITG